MSNYKNYLKTEDWKNFREAFWKRHKRVCPFCRGKKNMVIHHTHYGYLGRETEKHVVPMCENCHREFHKMFGVKTVMVEETKDFWKLKQMG